MTIYRIEMRLSFSVISPCLDTFCRQRFSRAALRTALVESFLELFKIAIYGTDVALLSLENASSPSHFCAVTMSVRATE